MNKTIRNLAIAALFIFPRLSGFPQEVQQDETPAAKPVVEENVAFPILIGIPCSNRQSDRMASCGRGDSTAGALSYKRVSRSASESLLLRLVNPNNPCGQRLVLREAEKKCRIRFATRKAWRDIGERRARTVLSGTWEACAAKAVAGVGRTHSSGEAGNDRGVKGFYV